MTNNQKEKIIHLRSLGCGYADIGKELNISKETVKSYCRRNGIEVGKSHTYLSDKTCRCCGQPILQTDGVKKRSFCSTECRLAWWHAHPESINKKALYTFTCAGCGKVFTAYGNKSRKYCSHTCYINARFKDGGNNE